MTTSTANVTPGDIILSPMRVTMDGQDLGGTVDSVSVSKKFEMADIMVDQFGKSVIDKVISGFAVSIKFTIAQIKDKSLWKVAFPAGHVVSNGDVNSFYVDMQVGDHLLTHAKLLNLHPLQNEDADLSDDWNFYKAASISAAEVKYGPDKQSGLAIEIIVFPDLSVSPARYLTIGDPSNGLIDASAGSPTPATGNVGNGTIDTIAVFNGSTATETITARCVGASTGNDFFVSGSQSGALGTVHVGATSGNQATFTSPQISFKINQGSAQFAYNDSFSIATVAANYS